jgi:hypothetical protein
MFSVCYLAVLAVRHMIIYGWMKSRHLRSLEEVKDPTQALNTLTASAIDLSAILQFALWVPIGFGLFGVSSFYLFMMPMLHEFYDVVYLNFVHRRRFTNWFVKFVMQHHVLSTLGRIILAGMIYGFVPTPMRQFIFQGILLFYCCSAFLIAPAAFEPFFALDNIRGRAILRLACFTMGRISHFFVVARFMVIVVQTAEPKTWIPTVGLCTLAYAITEYHSVVNGLPRLRGDWRRAERSREDRQFSQVIEEAL